MTDTRTRDEAQLPPDLEAVTDEIEPATRIAWTASGNLTTVLAIWSEALRADAARSFVHDLGLDAP